MSGEDKRPQSDPGKIPTEPVKKGEDPGPLKTERLEKSQPERQNR